MLQAREAQLAMIKRSLKMQNRNSLHHNLILQNRKQSKELNAERLSVAEAQMLA